MKTNITLKIETELLREARVLAAEEAPRSVRCSLLGRNNQCVNARVIMRHAGVPRPVFAKALTCAGRPHAHGMNFMSDKCFVDTNILVYAHDRSAGAKRQRAQVLLEQLRDSGQGVLSIRFYDFLMGRVYSSGC
jgi:hypothetical protein